MQQPASADSDTRKKRSGKRGSAVRVGCQKMEVISQGMVLHSKDWPSGTDHVLATKGIGRAGMRVAQWSARLFCFTYDVEYRPWSQNQAADCLSRLPLPTHAAAMEEPEMVASVLSTLSVSDLTSSSARCLELTLLRAQMERGWPKCKKDVDPALTPYFLIRHELCIWHTSDEGWASLLCSSVSMCYCGSLGAWHASRSSAHQTEATWTVLVASDGQAGGIHHFHMPHLSA